MKDAAERLNAFKRGEIDTIQQLARSDYAELLKDPAYKDMVKLVPRATLVYMAINTRIFPDRRVRQAIAMAIDRDIIANDYMYGTVGAAKGILPPGIPGHREAPNWLAPDVEKAKRLLVESGHPGGKGLPVLRISFAMENPDIERIADQIGSQLKDKLNIEVRLDKMETGALIAKQNRKELASVVSGWFADYVDPEDFLSILLTSRSPENHWQYSNPTYDALCDQGDTCIDPKLRLRLYAKAEDIALQDAVMIPLCYWRTPMITHPRVHGVRSYAAQFLPYNTVWIK
jgi:ABC-type oligopeptide transport system substrate-binding subunit